MTEKIAVSTVLRLINSLSIEAKLEVLSKLTENIKVDFKYLDKINVTIEKD